MCVGAQVGVWGGMFVLGCCFGNACAVCEHAKTQLLYHHHVSACILAEAHTSFIIIMHFLLTFRISSVLSGC